MMRSEQEIIEMKNKFSVRGSDEEHPLHMQYRYGTNLLCWVLDLEEEYEFDEKL